MLFQALLQRRPASIQLAFFRAAKEGACRHQQRTRDEESEDAGLLRNVDPGCHSGGHPRHIGPSIRLAHHIGSRQASLFV